MEKEVRYKGKKKSDTKGERSQIQREKEVRYNGKKKSVWQEEIVNHLGTGLLSPI